MKDELGKRMKENYEIRTRTFLPRRTNTIIRLDGKAFHTFTKDYEKPYDEFLAEAMIQTAKFLCKHTQNCKLGYVQSDEISLLLTDYDNLNTDAWFNGQIQKIASVSASLATAKFNRVMLDSWFSKDNKKGVSTHFEEGFDLENQNVRILGVPNYLPDILAFFDARVFTIPEEVEVENYFIWRQKDAIRNAVQGLCQSIPSINAQLHGKSSFEQREMLEKEHRSLREFPLGFEMGTMVTKTLETVREGNPCFDWQALSALDFIEHRRLVFDGLFDKNYNK